MLLSIWRLNAWLLAMNALTTTVVRVQGQDFDAIAVERAVTIVIGDDPSGTSTPTNVGWTDGVCYLPVLEGVQPGDTLEFNFEAHNVYKMASKEHFLACDFTDAALLAQVGESPFQYTVEGSFGNNVVGATETLYFACQVGNHCGSGTQKVQVVVTPDLGDLGGQDNVRQTPVSQFILGATTDECQAIQEGSATASDLGVAQANALRSTCEDPVPVAGQPGTYTRTCLSGPATLTPGGVVNRLFVLNYPFPMDHRVALGQRIFEFVVDDPITNEITTVSHRQLYIHHLAGRVVFSQGAESMGQAEPDAPFAPPYARFTGNDGGSTIFHLIDLREVDDWLSCVECRCPINTDLTYLDTLTNTGNITGGTVCCTNCTDLAGPTLDYRMRYNVTYRELEEEEDEEPLMDVDLLVADIALAVDNVLEYNVPSYQFLPADQQAPGNVQRLERVGPFNEIFQISFFAGAYDGPDEVQILRCVSHMHVASITTYLEDADTGERYCSGDAVYGTNAETDEGFLTSVSVDNHNPPISIPANRRVRFVTEYNATHVHTGVMGYIFLFVAGEDALTANEVGLTVPLCVQDTCDASLLPSMNMEPFQEGFEATTAPPEATIDVPETLAPESEECKDTLASHPSCTFGGLCDCETFVNAAESTGCDGFYSSTWGEVEVRSVCAEYCGCDVSIAVEEAVAELEEGLDCVDALANHPSCTLGGVCDCEAFVNAPESSGCGGVYASTWGDVSVDDVCRSYCGCGSGDKRRRRTQACEDKILNHPACTFGGTCDCETFVNSPASSGCGGVFTSEWGDQEINSICPAYCNACVDKPAEEIFDEAYSEVMMIYYRHMCQYDTAECRAALTNLYSCGSGQPGIKDANPLIQSVVTKRGLSMAQETARLGEASLHAGQQDQVVASCSASSIGGTLQDEPSSSSAIGAVAALLIGTIALLIEL